VTALVLDASVTMTWLLADVTGSGGAYASTVLEATKMPGAVAVVPVTWALEVSNVLARTEARDVVTEAQSQAFMEMLSTLPIRADEATFAQALTDTLQLARRHKLTSYDASYLELALRAGLALATLDADLARAARRAGVKRFAA
jgi:predicted nucleic acid-binding protein